MPAQLALLIYEITSYLSLSPTPVAPEATRVEAAKSVPSADFSNAKQTPKSRLLNLAAQIASNSAPSRVTERKLPLTVNRGSFDTPWKLHEARPIAAQLRPSNSIPPSNIAYNLHL